MPKEKGRQEDQCHYVRGSSLVRKRSGDLGEKLRTMMIEPERVRFESLEIRQSQRYVDLLQEFMILPAFKQLKRNILNRKDVGKSRALSNCSQER